ncbi:MAG: hypothetical protein GY696_35390 [Gammaproteobacteria bacterium]|nr:hypothetical protein [Gammaproteobacteria bacterium]
MELEAEINGWDGKDARIISVIYKAHHNDTDFLAEILRLLKRDEHLQKGASWLLKQYLEKGGAIVQEDIDRIYQLLPDLERWESKLQLLQSIPHLPISEQSLISVESFLRYALSDENKFIRAWAYNGFYLLSCQYPKYRHEAEQIIDMAMEDEAPSVKARIRNIKKQQD